MFAFEARGGPLTLIITESAGPGAGVPIVIPETSPLNKSTTVGVIDVDTDALNGSLFEYKFTNLGANSNSTFATTTGFVTQSGLVQLQLGGTGSITILATDNDFNAPPVGPGILHTSSTAEFTNATNGNTNGFQGWFNPSNTLSNGTNGKEVPSPAPSLLFTATGQPASDPHPRGLEPGTTDTNITLVHPYGLTSQSVITLTGGSAGATMAQDRFGGTVQTFSAIPEPASMALMLGALPVLVFGLMRRRRAAA